MKLLRLKLFFGFVFASFLLVCGGAAESPNASESNVVHFAFSQSLFADLNNNDAKAAIKVYSQIIADENGITTGSPLVLDGLNAMTSSLRFKEADLLSVTAEEFFAVEPEVTGPLLLTQIRQSFAEEMLLLTRDDSRLQQVADLREHSLVCSSDVRMSLGRLWLEVLFRENGLGTPEQAQTKITHAAKPALVVLPVFFGKLDACLVTRNSWEVMGELNPQVKKRLRVLAASPAVVPAMTCFRRGFSEDLKQRIIKAAVNSKDKPSFQQLMALFKTDDLGQQPLSVLETTRELVARHRRLCVETKPTAAVGSQTNPPPSVAWGREAK